MCSLLFDGESHQLETVHEECNNYRIISYDDLSRRDVRSLIFHLLYAIDAFDYQESLPAIVDNFNRGFKLDIPYAGELVKTTQEVVDKRELLDSLYKPLLANWRFDRISTCTKLILRFAVWEINYTETDQVIIINEAVELAKCFAEPDAYRFVNGILDTMIKNHTNKS